MKTGVSVLLLLLASPAMLSQTPEAPVTNTAISEGNPASVPSNSMTSVLPELDRLGTTAKQADLSIGRLRIEKWKTNSNARSAAQANADSVQRNLTAALPGLIDAVRSAPEDLNAEFKLYRNLNVLYDVFGTLTDATRVYGQRSDYEALAQQLEVIGSVRRKLGDALEQLTAATQHDLNQMRIQIKTQQQQLAAATAPPEKVVVAQAEPPKKAAPKKRTAAKKPATAASGSNSTSSGSTTSGSTSSGSNSSGHAVGGTTVPKP